MTRIQYHKVSFDRYGVRHSTLFLIAEGTYIPSVGDTIMIAGTEGKVFERVYTVATEHEGEALALYFACEPAPVVRGAV